MSGCDKDTMNLKEINVSETIPRQLFFVVAVCFFVAAA